MATFLKDEQHDVRNAIQCLEGWIRQLKKKNRITDQEKTLSFVWLKKINEVCKDKGGITCEEESSTDY